MKEQLLPFRFSQWWRLAVVGVLAGELGSSGGCNINVPSGTQNGRSHPFPDFTFLTYLKAHEALFIGLGIALVLIVIALSLLLGYIGSVMRFILFDSVVTRECQIRKGWARRKEIGFRLFVWQILFGLAGMGVLLIIAGIPVGCAWELGWFRHAGDHVMGLVVGGICLFLVLFAFFVFVGVVFVMTKDFVVPQMALENIAVMEGWRRLWLWIKHEKGGYAGYIGLKIVLAIAAAILLAIVTVIVFLVLLIIMGAIAAAMYFGAKAAGWIWNPYTIQMVVIVVSIAIAFLIFVAALINVPAMVFFPAYSIYFFAPRYAQLAALLWPEPAAPSAPAAPG
jgi:hypothetical protein